MRAFNRASPRSCCYECSTKNLPHKGLGMCRNCHFTHYYHKSESAAHASPASSNAEQQPPPPVRRRSYDDVWPLLRTIQLCFGAQWQELQLLVPKQVFTHVTQITHSHLAPPHTHTGLTLQSSTTDPQAAMCRCFIFFYFYAFVQSNCIFYR